MNVSLPELHKAIDSALTKYGYSTEEAAQIKDILLYAQLRGNNQGIVKLIGKGIPKRDGATEISLDKESPVSALVNGQRNHAMVVMNFITDLAIKKAKQSGIGLVGNYNSDESTGAIGYYVNKIAEAGLIGFAVASAPFPTTAPFGSSEAKFCTNPMAYGLPTTAEPIILDFSTSAMAYYGLIQAKTEGTQVPAGIGYDGDGQETTDPAAIMSGALKTFGGHKGGGLALVVQLLAGPLVKADSFDPDSENAGNLVLAIDPDILAGAKAFTEQASQSVAEIKNARKLPGVEEIMIPGERGNKLAKERLAAGEIEIEDNLWKALLAV